jgi:hypothetical protein
MTWLTAARIGITLVAWSISMVGGVIITGYSLGAKTPRVDPRLAVVMLITGLGTLLVGAVGHA